VEQVVLVIKVVLLLVVLVVVDHHNLMERHPQEQQIKVILVVVSLVVELLLVCNHLVVVEQAVLDKLELQVPVLLIHLQQDMVEQVFAQGLQVPFIQLDTQVLEEEQMDG
tara:strand:+ start:71 stop:400 length:330 start_codon:yes stop_codon:yes gene_type:complete